MTKSAPQNQKVPDTGGALVKQTRRHALLKRLLFSVVPVIVLFGALELILRGLGIPREKAMIGEFGFPPPALYETAFQRDPVRFWRLAPGYNGPWEMYKSKYTHEQNLSTNELRGRVRNFPDASYYRTVTWNVNSSGFRGQSEEPGKQVILFLGSSVTFGWGVRAEDSFSALIQKKLTGQGHGNGTVINAGVPGYSSFQCVKYLEEIAAKIRPRWIIVEVGINEGVWAPGFPDKQTAAVLEDTLPARLVRGSNLLFALNQIWRGTRRTAEVKDIPAPAEQFYYSSMYMPGQVRVPEEDFHDNLARLEEIARTVGADVFFLFPGLYNEYGEKTLVKSVRLTHPREIDIVAAITSAAGDKLAECFLPYDEAHLSVKGHRIVAERIWERLSDESVFKSARPAAPP